MRRIMPFKVVAALVVVGGVVAALALHRSRQSGPVEIGARAPAFSLPALGAGSVSLRDYRHKVVLVNFWATWCPPCVQEAPSLQTFSEKMAKSGVVVIGVSVDQDAEALQKFVTQYHLSFPIARDPNQALASHFGTFLFPATYVLDRDGRRAEKIIGDIDWQDPRIISFVRTLAGNSDTQTP